MKLICRASSFAAQCSLWLAAAVAAPSALAAPVTPAEQFYTRILGHWVGTSVGRIDDGEPVTSYFHLQVTRVDARTFREEYRFYRIHPKTGALEPAGTQTDTATISTDGSVGRTCTGQGTILIDFKPKKRTYQLTGRAQSVSPDRIEAHATGKVAVDGMPLGLGKKGKVRKATASWKLQGDKLVGETDVQTSFRALVVTKRVRMQSTLRAERGTEIAALVRRTASAAPAMGGRSPQAPRRTP